MCVSHEFDLGEVEIDFITFVPLGANRKKYFLVKEDRLLKEDILKSILEENIATNAEVKVARQIAKELKDQQVLKGVRGKGRRAAQPPGSFSWIIPVDKFYCHGV